MKISTVDSISKLDFEVVKDENYRAALKPLEEVLVYTKDYENFKDFSMTTSMPFMESLEHHVMEYILKNWKFFFKVRVDEEKIKRFFEFDTFQDLACILPDHIKNGRYKILFRIKQIVMTKEFIKPLLEFVDYAKSLNDIDIPSEGEEDNSIATASDTVNQILEEYKGLPFK